jgi:hypothetical protein
LDEYFKVLIEYKLPIQFFSNLNRNFLPVFLEKLKNFDDSLFNNLVIVPVNIFYYNHQVKVSFMKDIVPKDFMNDDYNFSKNLFLNMNSVLNFENFTDLNSMFVLSKL